VPRRFTPGASSKGIRRPSRIANCAPVTEPLRSGGGEESLESGARGRTRVIPPTDFLRSRSSGRTGRRQRLKVPAGAKETANPLALRRQSPYAGFFQDPETFETLRTLIFPRITQEVETSQTVRIWVPGCSSGEEVYSLAMAMKEYLGEPGRKFKIQIIGTDSHGAKLEEARAAVYPRTSLKDMSLARLDRFFWRVESGYRVAAEVRGMCTFGTQDLITDDPFSYMDLISCRNLLPHLSVTSQKQILDQFHFALKPTGFLLLGSSDSAQMGSHWYRLIDCAAKIYTKTKAEADLRATQLELRKLSARLLAAADDEGRKIARDLHDFFGPRLFDVEMHIAKTERLLARHSKYARRLREIRGEVSEIARAVSALAHTLHPAVVSQFGLVPALEAECSAFTRLHEIPVKLSADAVPEQLPESVMLCLYRVAQEALQNVRKHAEAPWTAIRVSGAGDRIVLVIQDFGRGFDVNAARGDGGLGLVSMAERVRLVGGTLSVESKAGGGTRIEACVPLPGS